MSAFSLSFINHTRARVSLHLRCRRLFCIHAKNKQRTKIGAGRIDDSGTKIIDFLKMNIDHNPHNSQAYAAAMKRCESIKDWQLALKIFRSMEKYGAPRSAKDDTILIDILCKNDQLELAIKMVTRGKGNIHADVTLYNCLLSGCKHRCNVAVAEQLWKTMEEKQLIPDRVSYNSMLSVYARSGLMDKAEDVWSAMVDSTEEEEDIRPDGITCALMMSGYSIQKNRSKVMRMQHFMQQHQIKMTEFHYSCVMKCYLKDRQPEEGIDFFNHEIKNKLKRARINQQLVDQLCCCYLQLMEQNMDNKRYIAKYWHFITKTVLTEYGMLPDNVILFDALLIMYDKNWRRIVEKFETAVRKQEIKNYWKISEHSERWIDLHSHSHRMAKFILNYVFHQQADLIKTAILDQKQPIVILIGNQSHNEGKLMSDAADKKSMRETVEQELFSWCPPIKTSVYDKESACLVCDTADVEAFLLRQFFKLSKKTM